MSELSIAKSISIQDVRRRSGGCALKAVVLTSGGLLYVAESRLREMRISLTVRQKSAEGIVFTEVGKARTVPRKGLKGVVSKQRDS